MGKLSPQLPKRKTVAATALVAAFAAALTSLSHPAQLRVDGQRMVSDVPPVTTAKGEAYVPLRVVAESLGADTNYDAKTGTIEMIRGNRTLRLHVGERVATLNGIRFTLHKAPFAVRGRAMVSLKTVERAFGTHVAYDPARAKIDVMSPGLIEAGAQEDSQ
jgi:hypothetical protein